MNKLILTTGRIAFEVSKPLSLCWAGQEALGPHQITSRADIAPCHSAKQVKIAIPSWFLTQTLSEQYIKGIQAERKS